MNNKGFAVTGVMYSVLLIFLIMISTMLFNLQNRKTILDELKLNTVDAVESENNYDYLLSEINALKANATTRYNAETDMIQVKYNGEWIDSIPASVQSPVALIETLSSNVGNEVTVSASSVGGNSSAYHVFDNNTSTMWNAGSTTMPIWLKVSFTRAKIVKKFDIQTSGSPNIKSTTFKLQGSNDDNTYVDLATKTLASGELTSYEIANTAPYKYYRLYITEQSLGTGVTLAGKVISLQLYGR